MLHKIVPPFLHTVHRHVFLKGPCGHSNIPKSPQMITSTGEDRKSACRISPERSVRIFRYSKISPGIYQYWCIQEKARCISPEGSVRIFQYSKISPDDCQYWRIQENARGLWLPQPAGAGSPLREGAIVCKGKKSSDIRRIRNLSTRPSAHPNPSGTANPRAPRRQSRRSSTQQDKRANARLRPSAHPNSSGTATQERPGGKAAAATPGRTNAPTRN